MVHKPKLLILDKPTSGVDPVVRDEFWALLVELSRGQGVTIFISTHFMNEAARCDRVSLMYAGCVLARDTSAALYAARGTATLEDAFIDDLEKRANRRSAAGCRGQVRIHCLAGSRGCRASIHAACAACSATPIASGSNYGATRSA